MRASVCCVFYTFAPVVTDVLSCYFCSGTAPIINGMATVTVYGLQCGVTYTIIAGGTLNGDLRSRTKITLLLVHVQSAQ